MNLEVTRDNRIICEECWNADSGNTFLASTKIDDRLSKDNLKFYKVKWVNGDGKFNKISLQPGDVVYLGDTPEQYADAIVGLTCDGNHVVYDYDKFAECLMKEGMTEEEAYDWIGYNTLRSLPYAGEYAPVMMHSLER